MIPVSTAVKDWKARQDRSPMATLYDVEISATETLRLVEGDPLGTGSLVYQGNTYLAAAITHEEYEQKDDGELSPFLVAVSNVNGVAGGYIEKNDLEGHKVTITKVLLETLLPADAQVEEHTIQRQQYNRAKAVFTLGHPLLTQKKVPTKSFARTKCRHLWPQRFLLDNGCRYPSDEFEDDTQQDFIVGAVSNAEQKRRYGWFTLNVKKATRFSVDGDADVPGAMYIESQSEQIDWNVGEFDAPFAYKKLSGDFDVSTQVVILDRREGSLIGFLCQEDVAGLDSWVLFGITQDVFLEPVLALAAAENGVGQTLETASSTNSYLRMKRTANVFDVYSSLDGVTWTLFATRTVVMDASVRLGLCLSASQIQPARAAAFFPHFRFTAGGVADCLQTLDDCGARHDNTHRFGGEPGIPVR